ncbi:GNAT family N-acetyltransferase [Microvirga tunisiensis]|uniref:GNAT family N-acetyltransferase n=1 Tax=Microvirga tunisiensis TaxID=2108360 RepID=UPI00192DD439
MARLVGALLAELRGTPAKPEEHAAIAPGLLALEDRIFGFLASDGTEPVGVMMVSESHAIYAGGAFGVITELYVSPSHRSSGVAQRLINAGATLGRERGWRQLEVGAPRQPAWARSLQFYLRNGFSEVGPRLKLTL